MLGCEAEKLSNYPVPVALVVHAAQLRLGAIQSAGGSMFHSAVSAMPGHASFATQDIQLTRHAQVRLQQRGVPSWFLHLLIRHGKTVHDGRGAVIKTVDKEARRRLQQRLSPKAYANAERYFDVYAVVTLSDAVVTVAHRTRHRHPH
jgi:hypothetical protein